MPPKLLPILPTLLALLPALSAAADPFTDIHATAQKANPQNVHFTLQTTNNQRTFHAGEIIPLDFAFSATEPDRWQLDAALYDRSGRLAEDAYLLDTTDGIADPLQAYFETGFGVSGGMRAMPKLSDAPYALHFELNEWQRIDKPGNYRLYVSTGRVTDLHAAASEPHPVVSNIIEFTVLPANAAWSAAKLAEIKKTLDAEPTNPAAFRALRFLNTPDAARELAHRFTAEGDNIYWDCKFGLIGTSDRAAAITAMKDALVDPHQPIPASFLDTLGLLDAHRADPSPLPLFPTGNPAQIPAWQQAVAQRRAVQARRTMEYTSLLMQNLDQKQGPAKAVSAMTILTAPALPDAVREQMRAVMPQVFAELPADGQARALNDYWLRVSSPKLLPALLKTSQTAMRGTFADSGLRDFALWRAYQLDPKAVRPEILARIANPPDWVAPLSLRSILVLPDATLPELDLALAAQLKNPNDRWQYDVANRLICRYATDAILPEVRAAFSNSRQSWSDRSMAALLAYFLRVDKPQGLIYFTDALKARRPNNARAYPTLFHDVAALFWTPELQPLALAALQDSDSDVIYAASSALSAHGTPDAVPQLFAILANRTELPAATTQSNDDRSPEALQEYRIVGNTLLHALNWQLTPAQIEDLKKLCRTATARRECDSALNAAQTPYRITAYIRDNGELQAYLNQDQLPTLEDLYNKILQFPPDTRFSLGSWASPTVMAQDPTTTQLTTWLQNHKIKIVPEP